MISPVRKSDEGHYSCFVNNSIGSTESTIASLTIGVTMQLSGILFFIWDGCIPTYITDYISMVNETDWAKLLCG